MTDYRHQLEKAVGAVYAEADLRLQRAQLDLLRPEQAPHTLYDVKVHRRAEANRAASERLRQIGQYYGLTFNTVRETMRSITGGFRETINPNNYTLGAPK